jgi:D-threo-aldose 1-dehydrogenase
METFDTGFWTGGLQFEHRFDYSYDGIMRSHQDSLQRLGMNRVDMLVIHDIDRWHQGSDAMMNARLAQLATSGYRALEELKGTGQIRAIGAGLNESALISRFVDLCDLDFVLLALHYTLGDQDALEQDIPLCLRHKIGIVVGGVFNSGLYATGPIPNSKYNYRDPSPQAIEKATKIKAVCDRYEVPLAAAALQFPLHHPMVASVIPGAISPQQVLDNVAYFQWNIPIDLWAELKDQGLLRPDAPTP